MKYQITGDTMPVVICTLENGETMVCESGAMSWMTSNMEMQTTGGGAGKVFGRLFSGEHMFQNLYTAKGGAGLIAFASSFPGSIRAVEITPDHPVIIQKRAFLACTEGVDVSVFFQKKVGTALFGGEGLIMQKLSGNGVAFLEIDGASVEYELKPGQQLLISSGHLAMMDESVSMDIQQIKGVKNVLFGGESLFNTVVSGPGKVLLQSMPLSNFIAMVSNLIPRKDS